MNTRELLTHFPLNHPVLLPWQEVVFPGTLLSLCLLVRQPDTLEVHFKRREKLGCRPSR